MNKDNGIHDRLYQKTGMHWAEGPSGVVKRWHPPLTPEQKEALASLKDLKCLGKQEDGDGS